LIGKSINIYKTPDWYLTVTNAAGGLNSTYKVGDVVVLHDVWFPSHMMARHWRGQHINFAGLSGVNPLRGPNLDDFGPRFIALSDAYDLELRRAAHLAWKELSKERPNEMAMHEGVYAFVGGPKYVPAPEMHTLLKLCCETFRCSCTRNELGHKRCCDGPWSSRRRDSAGRK